jgi:primosomal protein N' (replication factor Y)
MSESSEFFHESQLVSVLTAQPIDRVLDYKAPEGGCFLGAFVEVPLGPRKVLGVVWGAGRGGYDPAKIRFVNRVLDLAPMTRTMREFLIRAGEYTLTPMSVMLRLATRAPGLMDPPSMRRVYQLNDAFEDGKMTPARERVLGVMEDFADAVFTLKELADLAEASTSVIKGLAKLGAVLEVDRPRDMPFRSFDPDFAGKDLTDVQADAAAQLVARVQQRAYSTTLLRGVTGSGKTEVYLEAVAETLRQGRQALVLLPEIALTSEFLTRVVERFGAKPAEWHSGVTMTERRRIWKMVGQGGAQLVIGARSSLYLPFRDLGLIVVDEEHDTSYKQEDGALYNARDMSVLRASIAKASVILASATPSLETWVNAESGKYHKITMADRFGPAVMPDMSAVDMRQEKLPSDRWVSSDLVSHIKARMLKGEQSMLFINRRGYAPITLCRACGHQIGCKTCDARMVEHRFLNRLMCHQCGETEPMPDTCENCRVEGRLAPVGPGVERLAEEAKALFPDAKIAVLSSDLFSSARSLKAAIAEIANGDIDIIIGTQLVAKGHNFPNLTLVGVIDADLGLQGSDLRAAERTFQLMRQVAGRAGRSEKPGAAYLQTYQPEHPVIRAILGGEEEAFWNAEAAERQAAQVPPFGRLAAIIISAPEAERAFDLGNHLLRNAGPLQAIGAQIFGPAPAPIARVRSRFRGAHVDQGGEDQRRCNAPWRNGLRPVTLKGD